jgi:long-chain acyl-CoA synthetase
VNIAEEIFKNCDPAAPAILHRGGTLTYGDLEKQSARFAEAIRPVVDQAPHARIGLYWPDSADYIAMALAILRAGGCFVPIAPELCEKERTHLINEVALDAVVSADQSGELSIERPSFELPPPWLEQLHATCPAFIRFTSGTTGDSKGIVISHETLLARIRAANAGLGIGSGDRVLWVLPMAHHFAVSIMLYLWHGAAVVLPGSHLAADILQMATSTCATVLYAAPFHYETLAGCENSSWPSLRLAVSTTAALPATTAKKFFSAFGVFPTQALGIIEVGLPCINVPDPEKRPESIGRPQPAFEAEVRGEDGVLHLRGPGCLDAYLSPWRSRAEILDEEGWFSTGDMASIDEQGFITLHGRSRSVIGVGGMKLFPEEVERVLNTHPSVRQSRVWGRPHPDFGMVPMAEVVIIPGLPTPKPLELAALCRANLSRYKIPAEILVVDSIPLTASGKIKRV